jgi:hypothetical protein
LFHAFNPKKRRHCRKLFVSAIEHFHFVKKPVELSELTGPESSLMCMKVIGAGPAITLLIIPEVKTV